MTNTDPLEAEAINALICSQTGITVGIEYLWNTGETAILWLHEEYENFQRHRLDSSAIRKR